MKDSFGPDSPQPTDHGKWLPGGSSHRHILSQSWLIRTHPLVYSALTLIPLFLSVFVILHFLESRGVPMTRSVRLPIDSMSEKFAGASLYSPLASAFRVALPPSIDILDDDIGVSTLPSCSELFFAKRKPSLGPSATITGPSLSSTGLPLVFIIGFDHGNERSRLLTMLALENLLKTTNLRSIAFEFSSDLQSSFNKYYASPKRAGDKQEFASSMIAHCPLSAYLDNRQKAECARRLLGTESIMSVLDVAELASRYKATVVLVDTPMATVSMTDPMISYRNQIIAKNVLRNVHGDKVLLIVGSAHTGHGDLGLSLDDRLMSLGARTLSINVAAQKVPPRRDWGTNHASADFRISDPMELASLLARRYPGM
ncbi:MAG: hypothetical protein K8R57_05530 [Verrucomicrobia bacterium]|nr:hypothetical protein [Verrucomicrobiota bacterium]